MKLDIYTEQGIFEIFLKPEFIIFVFYQSFGQNLAILTISENVKSFSIFQTSSVKFHIHINQSIFEISLELEFIIFQLFGQNLENI